MTGAERREKNRLRLRALATGARHRPATARKAAVACGRYQPQQTWYRRRKKAPWTANVRATFERAEAFAAAPLARDLARCAGLERETMAIIAELTAYAAAEGSRLFLCYGSGYRDCHIEPDWLLLYKIDGNDLTLARTGTPAVLFS